MKSYALACLIAVLMSAVLSPVGVFAQETEAMKAFVGYWDTMLCYSGGGGRITVSWAEKTDVTMPATDLVQFKAKPMAAATPVFETSLRHDAAGKIYILNVKTTENPHMLENVSLKYDAGTGSFSGEGTFNDLAGKSGTVKVTIKATDKGGYEWTVSDPKAPKDNDTVLEISLIKKN